LAFLRALRAAPSGLFALVAMVALLAIAVLAPALLGRPANEFDFGAVAAGPSPAHPLGTDQLGRDLLARMLVATRLSIGMGLLAEVLAYAAGVPLGALTALVGRRWRTVLMRVIDTMIAFPGLLVTIYLVTILGPRIGLLGLAVGLAVPGAFRAARVVSALSLSIAGRDYLAAARLAGVRTPRLVVRYLVPNMAETLITSFAVGVSFAIVAFSGLSFLGIGVQPPNFDWGRMLSEGSTRSTRRRRRRSDRLPSSPPRRSPSRTPARRWPGPSTPWSGRRGPRGGRAQRPRRRRSRRSRWNGTAPRRAWPFAT
jgi:peptide/nickel transport system permease protein